MEHVEYVYTEGMDGTEVETRLREGNHGVLGLAKGNDAYAVPLHYHHDGNRLLFRVSEHDAASENQRFLRATETATFVCYAESATESWSIRVRGAVRRLDEKMDEATFNEMFPPFHLFDEAIEDVEFALYELDMDTVVGRKSVE